MKLYEDKKERRIKLNDTINIQKEIDGVIRFYLNRGFLAVRLDSLIKKENLVRAYFYVGEKYKWAFFSIAKTSDVYFLNKYFFGLERREVDVDQL